MEHLMHVEMLVYQLVDLLYSQVLDHVPVFLIMKE